MKKIKQILLYLAAVILLTIGLTLIFNEPIQNMIVSHNTETVRTAITRDQIQKKYGN